MSLTCFKSFQTINSAQQKQRLKTQLDIVHSYLNIDSWTKPILFTKILNEKLALAKSIKKKLMQSKGIKNHQEVVGFKCQVLGCCFRFSQSTALGGHMSKSHPNYKKEIKLSLVVNIGQEPFQKIKKQQINNNETTISQNHFETYQQLFQGKS